MLTKDLLKFRIRNGKAVPSFIPIDDAGALATAKELLDLFSSSIPGISVQDLEDRIQDSPLEQHPIHDGLAKLLHDRCVLDDEDSSIATRRREMLLAAKKLRDSTQVPELKQFQLQFSQQSGSAWTEMSAELYADLPENRVVRDFKTMTPRELINRYNVALVQGVLLKADRVTMTLREATIHQKRSFFRYLKFHRLMAEVDVNAKDKDLTITVSGPLSLFEGGSAYGFRLATFFPYILTGSSWSLEAEVALKNRRLQLSLNQKSGLECPYVHKEGYIPEEFQLIFARFNDADHKWSCCPGEDFIPLGNQSYCFPDLKFSHQGTGREVYVELFHRWHQGQLLHRLSTCHNNPNKNLILGICSSLKKNPEVLQAVEIFEKSDGKMFWFQDLPAPRTILNLLTKMV